jgi:large subunit ribosomal protein L21
MSNEYAVIRTGGSQFSVSAGTVINVPKLEVAPNSEVVFDDVLFVSKGETKTVGTPVVSGAKVVGRVLRQFRDKKVIVYKRNHKGYTNKKGHRQYLTRVVIESISI